MNGRRPWQRKDVTRPYPPPPLRWARPALVAVAALLIALCFPSTAAEASAIPPCDKMPKSPGDANFGYDVEATNPNGLADGVCIVVADTGGWLNNPELKANAAGCGALPLPKVSTSYNKICVDWPAPCAAGGDTVIVNVWNQIPIPLGVQTGCATWGAGGVAVPPDGDCTVAAKIGGLVELFVDSSEPSARAAEGGGAASFPFPAIAGTAAAAAAAALVAGGWYARRRFSKG